MSSKTPNFNLHKIDLTDAPPDITVLNQNWDILDEEVGNLVTNNKLITYTALDQLGLTPGSETISSIVNAMVDNSFLQMSVGSGYNVSQYPRSGYGTLVVFKKNSARTLLLFGYTNTDEFEFYTGSYYNNSGVEKWSGWHAYLPTSGGTMTGNLDFQKVNNGHGGIYKNHSATADYGMVITDEDATGNTAKLTVCAAENNAFFFDNAGARHELYGEHNEALIKTNLNINQRLYTDLSQIGLTEGSETIETIATKLPTYSRLILTVGSTNNLTIYPNSNFGLLIVEKTVNSRVQFTFTNNQGARWIGMYAIASSGHTWTDWYETAKLSNDTFTTSVKAKTGTDYTTYRVRNAAILSATPSSMTNGEIAFVYS